VWPKRLLKSTPKAVQAKLMDNRMLGHHLLEISNENGALFRPLFLSRLFRQYEPSAASYSKCISWVKAVCHGLQVLEAKETILAEVAKQGKLPTPKLAKK
jgi:hypothetical protein